MSEGITNKPKKPRETQIPGFNCCFIKHCTKEILGKTKKLELNKIEHRTGDVVVITGGGRGIGTVVVKKLLQCDFHVVMGLRNVTDGEKQVSNMRLSGIKTGTADFLSLDLSSLNSVQNFGKMVLEKYPKISILICNAGIMATPYKLTEDGFESQFQVDYLSHFLLTNILLDRIVDTARSSKYYGRIVNVSSIVQCFGQIKNISDFPTRSRLYNKLDDYADAKLCQVASANYLNRILAVENAKVCCYSVHPGIIPTELFTGMLKPMSLFRKILRTKEAGADVILCAAVNPDLENRGGVFLMNCKIESPNPDALDESLQEKLWSTSAELLKIDSHPFTTNL